MTLYYFDFQEGDTLYRDDVGTELEASEIEEEAIAAVADSGAEQLRAGKITHLRVTVRNADGSEVISVHLSLRVVRPLTR
jgi:hypothetical protein